ncbi:MAG: IS256 family transposase [Acidobacteriaceae bacterium]|nr:IS256 family transposase [Acidobacteriaceae bacterium]
MKRRYQIEKQRAVNGFRQLAAEQNPTIQMMLPMAEIVGLLQQGVGHLLREAGLALMRLVMEEEVRHLAGERHEQHEKRQAHRWGKEDGYCVIDGQKVPMERTRLRTKDNREQRLGSYELFQRNRPLEQGVWEKIMRGLSTRNYGAVVRDFSNAYGIEKSAVSENFIEASRDKVKQLMERPLGDLRLCALVIDATPFKDRQIVVALGIGCDGRKTVLGLREGATENATVVGALLTDLLERGLDFSTPRLYVLDGGKALHTAVRRHAGDAGLIQRCQVHKKRNVIDHLPEEHKADVRRKLQNAYAMADYEDAKRALERLHHELMHLNPSAARSLEEGLEETLTVHKLRVPNQLRRTVCCTNVIESAFSIVETVCRNVKRWQGGDQIERWVGSGLLVAEQQFRKVIGFRQIPSLLSAMADAVSNKPIAKKAGVA